MGATKAAKRKAATAERPPARYMTEDSREVFVTSGLNNRSFGTFFQLTPAGSFHRFKSPRMPMVPSKDLAQRIDDAAAATNQHGVGRIALNGRIIDRVVAAAGKLAT